MPIPLPYSAECAAARGCPTVNVDRLKPFFAERAGGLPAPGPVSNVGMEDEHEVELLLNRRTTRDVTRYLVWWRGHASSDDEWLRCREPARQQNSLFRQFRCFFTKWGLFFAKWGLFFANFFDHARVLYSEPSASDRSISRLYERTSTSPPPLHPARPTPAPPPRNPAPPALPAPAQTRPRPTPRVARMVPRLLRWSHASSAPPLLR